MSDLKTDLKITYLTAGAGGMFCGSCMHDNALATALKSAGWDIQLVATYTPIRTDDPNVSVDHVLFGGLNVYLQQKIPLLRYLPMVLDRFLDNPKLIRRVTANASGTDPKTLGSLAVSMLKGTTGNQRKEVRRMTQWLALAKPDALIFSNILIAGALPEIKKRLKVPVIVTLQGDDVFLDSLVPKFKQQCIELIRNIANDVDGFIVHSQFYADYISNYFGISKSRFHVTPLGIDTTPFWDFHEIRSRPSVPSENQHFQIGYVARLAPEKGLHHLVDGFIHLKKRPGNEHVRLKIAGWQSDQWKDYTEQQWRKLSAAGLAGHYENCGSPERGEKLNILKTLDVLSVPTDFLEPKGLYALEAMAAGVPVVLPAHGAFPEMIDSTGGGILVPPKNPEAWADAIESLMHRDDQRIAMAQRGQQAVHRNRNASAMADNTGAVIREILANSK